MRWVWVVLATYLSYGAPSVFLYFLTFIILRSDRDAFKSSFFSLYRLDGALNLITYFNNWFKTRIPSVTTYDSFLGPFYQYMGENISLKPVMFLNFHMAYVQYGTTTLISLNRSYVLARNRDLGGLSLISMWILIFAIFFAPIVNTRAVFDYPVDVTYSNETESYSIGTTMPLNVIFDWCIPYMFVFATISVFSNFYSVRAVRKIQTQLSNKKLSVDINHFIITSVTAGSQLFGAILSGSRMYYNGTPTAVTLSYIIPFMSDSLSLCQPWLLTLFSHAVKQMVVDIILRRKPQPIRNTRVPFRVPNSIQPSARYF